MYFYPDIVEQFTCAQCGRCCRNDWLVTVDEAGYQRNAELFDRKGRTQEFEEAFITLEGKGALGEYAYIAKKPGGGCWFLEKNNLCRLQREAGHAHLDVVCQTFPRYPMNTARGIELTLSFSCPEVIRLVDREAPLSIVRSEYSPIRLADTSFVAEVYPQQQPVNSPLRYYFELEQHLIDIMQCRQLTIRERLDLLQATVREISSFSQEDDLARGLNNLFQRNYDSMDQAAVMARPGQAGPDTIVENYLVNFIFKKSFYIYGLQRAAAVFERVWQCIQAARSGLVDTARIRERTVEAILELEFQHAHNRRAFEAIIREAK